MSDDVSYAASIGASINRGLGSIRAPKKKESKKPEVKENKGAKKVKSTRTNASTSEKKDKNIIDAEIVEPTKVKSERINVSPNAPTSPKQLSYSPNVGAQFKGYKDTYGSTYGSTHTQPPTDLGKY